MSSPTNPVSLDDLFDSIRGTCEDCEHPRCLDRIKSAEALINKKVVEARIDEMKRLWRKQDICYDCQHDNPTLDDPVPYISLTKIKDRINQLTQEKEAE